MRTLPRRWARAIIVLTILSIALILTAEFLRAAWLILVGAALLVVSYLLMLEKLRCPRCGKDCAPPAWSTDAPQRFCRSCGSRYVWDDEV